MSNEAYGKGLATFEKSGSIGTITLRRQEKKNALNYDLWLSLADAVKEASIDEDVRVVLLKGEGDSFCTGLDLNPDNKVIDELSKGRSAKQKVRLFNLIKMIQSIHTELELLRVPVIAAIQGHCLGAGLELACSCDMRYCSTDAVFSLPEAKFAIITDVGGLQRLPRIVGRGKAREMAFRGHSIGAEEAHRIGLINEVFDTPEVLFEKVNKIAGEIAGNPPLAVQGAKEVLLHNEEVPVARSLEYNAARSAMILPSEDLLEALNAYLEERKPEFKGN
ncbi:MAG: enoyl-CoA hydratase-related protein [Thermodesulfobacteriota bacterium]|nr:enoyl-CoA hydratase-related protein [Thermodesulfobacteriota bacterium]